MNVIENTEIFPPRKHFVEVEEKFTKYIIGGRVLPVTYFEDPSIHFTLKAMYQPGDKKTFPNGGFEVYGPEGGVFNYELDQVVMHPFHYRMMNYFSKSQNVVKDKIDTGEKKQRGRPRKDPSELKTQTVYVPTGGTRGRKPMDPALKALREAEKAERTARSTGKRGRPPLDPLVKAAKEAEKAKRAKKSGGKRGRPKKMVS
jgi:hypothetical protein